MNYSKSQLKQFAKVGTTVEQFESRAAQFINSLRQGTMICQVVSVSRSGMSRNFYYFDVVTPKDGGRAYISQYDYFFKSLGYRMGKYKGIIVNGCGMDMNFATIYNVVHELKGIGLLTKEECEVLAQLTPPIV